MKEVKLCVSVKKKKKYVAHGTDDKEKKNYLTRWETNVVWTMLYVQYQV